MVAGQTDAKIIKKIAVNVVLQCLGEPVFSQIASFLKSHYNITICENGDISCSLYELSIALEQLIGEQAAQIVLQDVYVEIDELTTMLQNEMK